MALPTYVASGALASGIGDVVPALPTGWAENDIFLLACETANEAVAAPSGWTEVANSPQSNTTANATRLTLFYKRATSSESAPTVTDPGNHCLARIAAFRGCETSGTPYDISSGSNGVTDADGIGTVSGATTTVADCLIVIFFCDGIDAPGAFVTSWTNADLASLTERYDEGAIAGNGGGLAMATGGKSSAGTYVATSVVSVDTSASYAGMTVSLKPAAAATEIPLVTSARW